MLLGTSLTRETSERPQEWNGALIVVIARWRLGCIAGKTSAKRRKVYIHIPTNRYLTNVSIFSHVQVGSPIKVNTQGQFLVLEVICLQTLPLVGKQV